MKLTTSHYECMKSLAGAVQKTAFIISCAFSLTAYAKTEVEMCNEMVRKHVTLSILADAPMNANPELINYRVEERLGFITRDSYQKCEARVTKEEYQCVMNAKTKARAEECDAEARWVWLKTRMKSEMGMCREKNRKLIALHSGKDNPSDVNPRYVDRMMGLRGYEKCVSKITKEEYQCVMDAKTSEAGEACSRSAARK